MLGLATAAPIAVMAFIGVSSAMAVADNMGFCAEKAILCPEGKRLMGGVVKVLAHSNLNELKNNSFFSTAEKCTSDNTIEGLTVGEKLDGKNPMKGRVSALTFTECSGPCKKVEAKGLPWGGEVTMTSEMEDMYTQTAKEGQALLSECTFGTKCEYGVPAAEPVTLLGEGNLIKAEAEKLEYKSGSGEGVCGSIGTWTATLEIRKCHLADGGVDEKCYFTLLP
jgi:hypothetical protein